MPQLERLETVLMAHQYYIPGFVQRDLLRTMQSHRWVVDRTLQSLLREEGDFAGKLGQLQMPVLLVWGQQDELLPPSVGHANARFHSAICAGTLCRVRAHGAGNLFRSNGSQGD